MTGLPTPATAPFHPSEIRVDAPERLSGLKLLARFIGPGLLIAVGYMDPGNWATDIQAGARYGYTLLSVVALSGLSAIVLQVLSLRLGLATGRDLAQLCRERYPRPLALSLFALAEVAIIACDMAEVLGSALALRLLLHAPLALGVALTGFDTLLVLGLKGRGFRQLEAIVLGLVGTIAACFAAELIFARPDWGQVAAGFIPSAEVLRRPDMLYVAVGVLGATVMPHNLYLHSALVQSHQGQPGRKGLRTALRFSTGDTVASLVLALLVNAAILIVAAAAFHRGAPGVEGIEDAYRLLTPLTGATLAGLLFGVALLASGQSSTFTGTIAGQVVLEGFLGLKIPSWRQRAITRLLAILPALAGVLWLGDHAVGRLLVLTQVVLSAQLPFAIWPLVAFTSDRGLMGSAVNPAWLKTLGWALFAGVTAANLWLIAAGAMG